MDSSTNKGIIKEFKSNISLKCLFFVLATFLTFLLFFFIQTSKNYGSNIPYYFPYKESNSEKTVFDRTNKPENKKITKSETNKYVLLSSTFDADYTFNLPAVVFSWRRLSIEPIVLIIYDDLNCKYKENSSSATILKYLESLNVQVISINADSNNSIFISQNVRLFAGIFPDDSLTDQDFVMTSDSELAVFRSSYFNVDLSKNGSKITVWNAFCCSNFRFSDDQEYPMYPLGK